MSSTPRFGGRRFLFAVVLWGMAHYAGLLALGFVIFVLSHLPTNVVHFDPVIVALASAESVLVAPRKLMLRLWPGESTPGGLGLALTILNSAVWGVLLAAGRAAWRRMTT